MGNVIEVKHVSFKYEETSVLKNVSFAIEDGDFVCLSGSNGVGKSTMLNIILGLLKPDKGTVSIYNENVATMKNFRKIGYVPQNANSKFKGFPATVSEILLTNLYQNIGFMKFSDKTQQKQRIQHILSMVSMQGYENRLISNLSAGQVQRVMLARALINSPMLLILDEPTTGVDPKASRSFYELLKRLNDENKITILMVSHDIERVYSYSKKVLRLNDDGKLSIYKKGDELLNADDI